MIKSQKKKMENAFQYLLVFEFKESSENIYVYNSRRFSAKMQDKM